MPNIIEQSTRTTLGLDLTPSSSVQEYIGNILIAGIPVTNRIIDGTDAADTIIPTLTTTNYIFGFGGNDTLHSQTASGQTTAAILVGGAGADTFVYGTSATNLTLTGSISDFSNADGDVIDLTSTGLSFSDLTINQTSNASAQIIGTGVNINISGLTGDVVLNSSNVITSGQGSSGGTSGTTGNDNLTGTDSADTISASDGDDTVAGGQGNDSVNGNAGADSVAGGDGDDTVLGGQGNDVYVQGNAGADLVNSNLGNDNAYGGQGNDTVRGGQGDDFVNGNLGDDTVYGDLGGDTVRGGQGADILYARDGNDFLYGDKGNDTLSGGEGVDVFLFTLEHGTDVVTDFVSGTDELRFSTGLFATADEAFAAVSYSGGNATVTTSAGTVTLQGIADGGLTVGDFGIF